jgi:hypothetical protein
MQIALALIKRLVAIGQLDADDVAAICEDLPEQDQNAVKAAWIEGLTPNGNKAGYF